MEKAIAYKVVARFKLRKGMKKKVLVDKKHSIMKNSRVIFYAFWNVATHARKFSQWWHSEPQEIAEKGDDTKVTFYLILFILTNCDHLHEYWGTLKSITKCVCMQVWINIKSRASP